MKHHTILTTLTTTYVQNISPGKDKEDNWLPAPKEVFSLYVRCYGPKEAVLKDEWNPPAVIRTK